MDNIYIDSLVMQYMNECGLDRRLVGYASLKEAILICIKEPKYKRMMEVLYQEVACLVNATQKAVARRFDYILITAYGKGHLSSSEFILRAADYLENKITFNDNGNMEKKNTALMVMEYIDKQNFKHALIGYHYLRTAIDVCLKEPEYLHMTGKLFAKVATMYNKTPKSVERGIEHCISSSLGKGHSTPSEFIARTVDYFNNQLGDSKVI